MTIENNATENNTTVEYGYDEKEAGHADDIANRIDQNAAYIGSFKRASAVTSSQKGTKGINFTFESPGGGDASFTLWTKRSDGTSIFGMNLVQAMMLIVGVKGLRSEPGKVMEYDADVGRSVEVDGERFPSLEGKRIGAIFQKELYTKNDNSEGWRMNLYGVFAADSRLTASEIKEGKTVPVKLERMLRGLKTKDSRKAKTNEPAQAALGLPAGDY
jgi:hypothetical protein